MRDPKEYIFVRRAAANVLGAVDASTGQSVHDLIEVFRERNHDDELRWNAMDAVEALGPITKESIPLLIKLFRDTSYEDVDRREVAEAIAAIGPAAIRAAPVFLATIRDEGENWFSRYAAAEALPELGEAIVPLVIPALQDPSSEARRLATEALGELGNRAKPAIGALKRLLDDADPEVRESAEESLKRISED